MAAEIPGTDPEEGGCSWCEKGSGMILVAGAVGLLYIGIDLMTGGALSRLFVGGVTAAADAIDPEHQDDGGPAAELHAVTDEPSA
jgi:hypothetical protein